ncbi:MAG TPA: glucoamylase [Rhodobacteraceae bacterium]|nr:glucoamylase [Paracoccaceae bacterium]
MNLGMIGNCSVAALVDDAGEIRWFCLPRFDGDPVFHSLLGHGAGEPGDGAFGVDLEGFSHAEQSYDRNTAILRTTLHGASGSVEIVDFCPRFESRGRHFRPQMLIRRLRPVSGWPRVRIRLRPCFDWGTRKPHITRGSNHVRFVGGDQVMRLTTDAPIDHVLDERMINLDRPLNFVLGPDETLADGPAHVAESFERDTCTYWRRWVRRLAIPLDWQEAVIRAAITLKLCNYEATGGIVAAMTTSIPEAPGSERNWDYRYCWVRDAFFTVRALNSLAATRTMESYFHWLMNLVADAGGGHIQPVLGVGLETELTERRAEALQGYQGMGPVRVGNQAHEHFQHDTYGNVILGAAPAFFDDRLFMDAGIAAFEALEPLGDRAWDLHDKPDAGIWELRTRARVHTSSSLMCWAGCDRLAKIARHLGLEDRAEHWENRARAIRHKIEDQAWSEKRGAYVESFGGETLDASVLLMSEVGFVKPDDARFISTVEALSETLGRGPFMLRYEEADDFGVPEVGFNVCAFWRVDALARIGRVEEARAHFEGLLAARNHLGLMSEDSAFEDGALWGNFPQTYSMVGIVNGAMRLSRRWETEL